MKGKASNRRRRPFQYLVSYTHSQGTGHTTIGVNRGQIYIAILDGLVEYVRDKSGFDEIVITNIIKM